MNLDDASKNCQSPACGCDAAIDNAGMGRRQFLKVVGLGAAALPMLGSGGAAMAGPFEAAEFARLIPADKKLSQAWTASLFARGARQIYRGAELELIGMPVGGLCAGQLYLGGDGRLWHWDIFNATISTGAEHYANPLRPASPVDQGFALRIKAGQNTQTRTLDRAGFADVAFCGEYPLGFVEYRDEKSPVNVSLQAFSPFIPLNAADSGLPATIMEFTLANTSAAPVECELAGWLENAVALHSAQDGSGTRRNKVLRRAGMTFLECSALPAAKSAAAPRVFADFEGGTYGTWKTEGEAFGNAPAPGALGTDQTIGGFEGKGLVNTYRGSDAPRGRLISPDFLIERPFISFLIGGGNHPGETCLNLVVDGKIARTQTGRDSDALQWSNWNVRDFIGQKARLEIVDNHSGSWGHIDIDQIEFGDAPRFASGALADQPDFGTMGLALLEARPGDRAQTSSALEGRPGSLFEDGATAPAAEQPFGQKLCGALSRTLTLAPGQKAKVTFLVAWHFPNLRLDGIKGGAGRHYSRRFISAAAVAEYVARNFASLAAQTRLWHETWHDSTLPHWFLDRTFANVSILATSTAHWFQNGRFYGWEGVGCCAGTCTHVWHYAHAVARLFPELERSAREMADFGISFERSGLIDFRGEFRNGYAADGQAGCILRAYREHQMSSDSAFLRRNWPKIEQALEFLIAEDADGDGVLEGAQHNTLDTTWYGPISWLSSLYLAALRAGEEMAREVGDDAFARRTRAIFDKGRQKLVDLTWNGEYFVQRPDPAHPEAMKSGNGCEIDQVFGQSWAFQIGLGRVMPREQVRRALHALWKYNFSPDVGPFRRANPQGRWYAMPGEAGLIMCTWPRGDRKDAQGNAPDWAFGYFNECMSGFEYQVAGHMIWEGMTLEGLAVTRAIHDRYHAARRNPWNEVECGDHYARAMASYGVFLAACGFEYHGPQGHLGFAPRLSPENFRAAFTAAEGWGTFAQQRRGTMQHAQIHVKWGKLHLKTLSLALAPPQHVQSVKVTVGGQRVAARHSSSGERLTVDLPAGLTLRAGQTLQVSIT